MSVPCCIQEGEERAGRKQPVLDIPPDETQAFDASLRQRKHTDAGRRQAEAQIFRRSEGDRDKDEAHRAEIEERQKQIAQNIAAHFKQEASIRRAEGHKVTPQQFLVEIPLLI